MCVLKFYPRLQQTISIWNIERRIYLHRHARAQTVIIWLRKAVARVFNPAPPPPQGSMVSPPIAPPRAALQPCPLPTPCALRFAQNRDHFNSLFPRGRYGPSESPLEPVEEKACCKAWLAPNRRLGGTVCGARVRCMHRTANACALLMPYLHASLLCFLHTHH